MGVVTRTAVGAESWWRDEDEAARADFSLVAGAVEVGVGRLDVGAGSRAGVFGRCWTGEEEVEGEVEGDVDGCRGANGGASGLSFNGARSKLGSWEGGGCLLVDGVGNKGGCEGCKSCCRMVLALLSDTSFILLDDEA